MPVLSVIGLSSLKSRLLDVVLNVRGARRAIPLAAGIEVPFSISLLAEPFRCREQNGRAKRIRNNRSSRMLSRDWPRAQVP